MNFNVRNQNQFSFSDLTSNLKLMDVIELGYQPHKTNSGAYSIAIGSQTGTTNQGTYGIAIGYQAGQFNQGSNAIAIGEQAGQNNQKPFSIAIGTTAGQTNQEMVVEQDIIDPLMITIRDLSGYNDIIEPDIVVNTQETKSIALGFNAGYTGQSENSIAIGYQAGQYNQGTNAIAIGYQAGQYNQETNAIAIGYQAGQTNQHSNSIILNASGNALNSTTNGLFIRTLNTGVSNQILSYNPSTFEITTQPNLLQIGVFKFSVRTSDHLGWLLCDGRLLNINEHPLLFAIMGYSFGGSGDFFQLPDPQSRMVGAIGQGPGLTNRTLGEKAGSETHTLTIDELPTHNHTLTDPGHTHTYTGPEGEEGIEFDPTQGLFAVLRTYQDTQTNSSITGITINNTGGGQPYDIMQPILFIGNLFVYAD
jgi:microcystin-dependent protein